MLVILYSGGTARLGRNPAELFVIDGGDHSFKVPKSARIRGRGLKDVQERIERWPRASGAPRARG